MNRLISIELRKNKINKYVIGSIGCCLFNFICFYIFAFSASEEVIFNSYESLVKISAGVNIVLFMCVSAVMYSEFIVDEYSGNKLILMFSYPINRRKWMIAKIGIVSIFTAISAFISEILIWSVYFMIESFFPILNGHISNDILSGAILTSILSIIIIMFGGFIALEIGMHFKTASSTIISSIIVGAIVANIIIMTVNYGYTGFMAITVLMVIIGFIIINKILNRVDLMEI